MPRAAFIGDESLWAGGHPPGHPLRPERLQATWEMLHAYHAFAAPHIQIVAPRPPTEAELAKFHTPAYIDLVRLLGGAEVISFRSAAEKSSPFDDGGATTAKISRRTSSK